MVSKHLCLELTFAGTPPGTERAPSTELCGTKRGGEEWAGGRSPELDNNLTDSCGAQCLGAGSAEYPGRRGLWYLEGRQQMFPWALGLPGRLCLLIPD
jgi:hypothetical protein